MINPMNQSASQKKSFREDFLRQKWGFKDASANASLEQTHQALLRLMKEKHSSMSEQLLHFEAKSKWEDMWQNIREKKKYGYPGASS